MNIKLLREVKEYILAEPKRLRMDVWICQLNDVLRTVPVGDFPECGTVACIAGWTHILGKLPGRFSIANLETTLGLKGGLSNKLFFTDFWDQPFRSRYTRSLLPRTRAKLTAEYIEYFIRKYQ